MKVKDVVDLLSRQDPEQEVYVSRDEEGNGFNPLYGISPSWMDPEDEVVAPMDICDHESDDDCDGPDSSCEWKRRNALKKVVVLWP